MSVRPDYAPVHRLPVWLSSEDVREAIGRVALTRGTDTWRACCWDIQAEINKLVANAPATRNSDTTEVDGGLR